jgi:hypothetical protein
VPSTFSKSTIEKATILETTRSLLEEVCELEFNYDPARYVVRPAFKPISEKTNALALALGHDMETQSIGRILFPADDNFPDDTHYLFGQSVIEWASKRMIGSKLHAERCLWFRKDFVQHPGHHAIEDRSHLVKVDGLISWMKHRLPKHNVVNIDTGMTREAFLSKDANWIEPWGKCVQASIENKMKNTITMKESWQVDGAGLHVPGEVLDEMLHHSHWAYLHNQGFLGRQTTLKRIMDFINSGTTIAFRCFLLL